MTINVTSKDIESGNSTADACPITIALRRIFGKKNLSVSRNYIRIPKRTKDKWKLVPLPVAAREFLLNYSQWHWPQPFSFEIPKRDVKILKG